MKKVFSNTGLLIIPVIIAAAIFCLAATAQAATTNVSDYSELISAISSSSDGDIINITQDITVEDEVLVDKGLTIEGNGFTVSVPVPGLDTSGIYNQDPSGFRAFTTDASGKTISLNDMTIKGGSVAGRGAGILNEGGTTLKLTGVTISNSLSANGFFSRGGGGLFNNEGTVYLDNCNISRNAADYGGGFFNTGEMFIENSTISENRSVIDAGGGGGGENQSNLYINNSTFANNKSTELGGAINNNRGYVYAINSTFTGNVAYNSSPSLKGGAIANNGGEVTAINSLFAYNYENTGTESDPVYALNDIYLYSFSDKINAYYCLFQDLDDDFINSDASNISYAGLADGSNNTIFAGGALTKVLSPSGAELGTDLVFQPFLIKINPTDTPAPVLKTSSSAFNVGTLTGFDNGDGAPTIGYYDGSSWITLLPDSEGDASAYQVTTDQNDHARSLATPAIGAVETSISNYHILKVNSSLKGTVSGGTIYGDLYEAGTVVPLTATANSGYSFVRWDYVLGGSGSASAANPYSITINQDTTLVPIFDGYTVTYLGNGNTGGSVPDMQVSPPEGSTTISDGSSLYKSDYAFIGWNTAADGTGTAYDPDDTYTSTGTDLSLYAQYESPPTYTLTYTAGTGGRISGSSTQTVIAGENGTAVTATPNPGYSFVKWSDDSTDNPRTDNEIYGNLSVEASFSLIPGVGNTPPAPPRGVGTGVKDEALGMGQTGTIGMISTAGVNYLSYIDSSAAFYTIVSNNQLETHFLAINSLDLANNIIIFTVQSSPQTFSLKLGEEVAVDLNGDKIDDIKIKFANVWISRAELTIKSLLNIKEAQAAAPVATTPATKYLFKRNLSLGATGADVQELQKYFNTHGFVVAKSGAGSPGKETTKFGPATKAALIKFQQANKIKPASGYFGPLTRNMINK